VEGSAFKNFLLGRNKIWTIAKNYAWPQLLWHLPVIVAYDLGSLPYTVVVKRDLSPVQGRLAALIALPAVLHDRRRVQATRRLRWHEFVRLLEPLEPPLTLFRRYRVTRRVAAGLLVHANGGVGGGRHTRHERLTEPCRHRRVG
jgi:hypothetical protein